MHIWEFYYTKRTSNLRPICGIIIIQFYHTSLPHLWHVFQRTILVSSPICGVVSWYKTNALQARYYYFCSPICGILVQRRANMLKEFCTFSSSTSARKAPHYLSIASRYFYSPFATCLGWYGSQFHRPPFAAT